MGPNILLLLQIWYPITVGTLSRESVESSGVREEWTFEEVRKRVEI